MIRAAALAALLAVVPVGGQPGGPPGRGESLTLCVLVDVTVSMVQLPGLGFDRAGADDQVAGVMLGLTRLLAPGDRLRFGRIARTVELGPAFVMPDDAGRAVRVLTVSESERYGPSPVWDAIDLAVQALEQESGHRAVIVWTDGRASGNRLSRFDVGRRAREAGIPVHAVTPFTERVIRQTESLAVRIRPAVYLEWLARETGGQFHTAMPEGVRPLGDPLAGFSEILQQLRRASR